MKAIDLGLPSGTKWANMNVGATKPEEYGLYFAWGETEGYGSDIGDGRVFNWTTYKWCNGSYNTLTKYNTNSSCGTVDNKTELDLADDAAHANWGGNWHMPSYDQIKELFNSNYTTSVWTSVNGISGLRVTSKSNGNSIFLPAAGYRWDTSLNYVGSWGYYWSSSLRRYDSGDVYGLYFNSGIWEWGSGYRDYGLSVRAVCP